ncbi:hypothetical protein ACIRYZ_29405 [Kitasatospora sp. NPDC101155]|uniref:hypothetical protein n=1 Tax=Kitasatospora sp. NPDC101155 TaxID=3364097 RepID=UPI00381E4F97
MAATSLNHWKHWKPWHGALALALVSAVTAGLLWWQPWHTGPASLAFTTAPGGSARFGTGEHLYRYKVRVENGIAERPEQFATEVDAVLGDTVAAGPPAVGSTHLARPTARSTAQHRHSTDGPLRGPRTRQGPGARIITGRAGCHRKADTRSEP